MRVELKCPHCGKKLEAHLIAEAELRCPLCGKRFHVPKSVIEKAEAEE